jgi:hypothetical protein
MSLSLKLITQSGRKEKVKRPQISILPIRKAERSWEKK